jgi:peptide/nickel transport system ATP-binding protein
MMDETILSIQDLTIHYKTDDGVVQAVNELSLELRKGETIGLVGETGAGKTTCALGIIGLIPQPPGKIISGQVFFEGQDLRKKGTLAMRAIRGNKISMIFQDPMTSLNPVFTVGDQIAEVIRLHNKISRAEATLKSKAMLEMVGITGDRYDEYPHQFSGGMKQRVIIAIALACRPALLIADEPTTALDVTIQAQVLELMKKLRDELRTSMIMITHDLGVVAEICHRVAIMYAGRIVETGTLTEIFENTKHPYTKGLFGSIPDIDVDIKRLSPVEGLMPDPFNLPDGCAFCPRCPNRMDICEREHPPQVSFSPDHSVRCFLYHDTDGRS